MTSTGKVLIASMILVSLVYLSTGADMGPPMPRLPKEEVEACEKEADITMPELMKNKDSSNEELAEKRDCFNKCIFTKEGALKNDGTIDIDEVKKTFAKSPDKDAATKLACVEKVGRVETCKDMRKVDGCLNHKM